MDVKFPSHMGFLSFEDKEKATIRFAMVAAGLHFGFSYMPSPPDKGLIRMLEITITCDAGCPERSAIVTWRGMGKVRDTWGS
jgi:hypothetical protein